MSISTNPLVSFLLFTYNHSAFVEDAIRGALAQTYSPLEVIISDDASTDDTQCKIQAMLNHYKGQHSTRFIRRARNLGLARHFNDAIQVCAGEWIVVAAGDDISEPDRTQSIMSVALSNPDVRLIQSYLSQIDREGRFVGIDTLGDRVHKADFSPIRRWGIRERMEDKCPAPHGATCAYSRKLFEVFRIPLRKDCIYEDSVMKWRAELLNSIALLRMPLVRYRNHEGQATNLSVPDACVVRSRRRNALDGSVDVTIHNREDLEYAIGIGLVNKRDGARASNWLANRQRFFELKRKALLNPWPSRILYFLRAVLVYPPPTRWSRRDVFEVVLPNRMAGYLDKLRTQLAKM